MQIVTDRGADLAPEQLAGLDIHYASLKITLDGVTYNSGVDIQPDEFYRKLAQTESYPTTTLPSTGEFIEIYTRLLKQDPEILSIHISSGLSGTYNSAVNAASMLPQAKITVWDTKTLSCPEGWQVQAAALALRAGWALKDVLDLLKEIGLRAEGLYTLPTLKYLIHGGRVSHMKGLLASLLNIKPIIGVGKEDGKYVNLRQERSFNRAVVRLAEQMTQWYPEGTRMRVQPLHAENLDGVALMKERLSQLFDCVWEPVTSIAPVLGAHTGAGLVGMAAAPMSAFAGLI